MTALFRVALWLLLPLAVAVWAVIAHGETYCDAVGRCSPALPAAQNASPGRAEPRLNMGTSSALPCIETGMPCALAPEDALRQAYQYCRADYLREADPATRCYHQGAEGIGWLTCADRRPAGYTLPACTIIAKRWEQSKWKKQDAARGFFCGYGWLRDA